MVRRLGLVFLACAVSVPVAAADQPGSITGVVRNSAGTPQMGAVVRLFSPALAREVTVFTDDVGRYSLAALAPGAYSVKVTAPLFLPSLRENVQLKPGASIIVNITLNTLFEAMQMPPPRRRTDQDEEDWKWTLRSTANRTILRVMDDGPVVVISEAENGREDRVLKARVAFLAGAEAEGFGSASDLTTAFKVEHSLFRSGTLSLDGRVGHGGGNAGMLRAAYRHQTGLGNTPEIALTVRQFATPENVSREGALQALSLSFADTTNVADMLEIMAGAELQSLAFRGRVNSLRPFGAASLHLGPNLFVQYRYATAQPNTRLEKGFDSAPADLTESGPRMSLVDGDPRVERAVHQEVSVNHRLGDSSMQAAVYWDRIRNAVLTGVGPVSAESGEFLPDVYSGTFSYFGGEMDTSGLRVAVQRRFGSQTATLAYSFGGVLSLDGFDGSWQGVAPALHNERRHALTARVAGVVPHARTRWIASYRWTSDDALTPVDSFAVGPGQADPFFNLFLRQPIPESRFLPGRMEAMVDVRNLLAEGYVPVLGNDGHTLYLVQSARSVRGGLAFIF